MANTNLTRRFKKDRTFISEILQLFSGRRGFTDWKREIISRVSPAILRSKRLRRPGPISPPGGQGRLPVPSLPPLLFPFVPGHRIIERTQSVLERACFDFTLQAMPDVLRGSRWPCAEAVELNLWVKEVHRRQKGGLVDAGNKIGLLSRVDFCESIAKIRHTAVHRDTVTAREMEKFLADGETLATMLGDKAALAKLSSMRSAAKRTISDMEGHRSMLETTLARKMREIADRRAALDRKKRSAIAGMLRSAEEYQVLAGAKLQQRLDFPTILHKICSWWWTGIRHRRT